MLFIDLVDRDPAGYGQRRYRFSYSRYSNTAFLVSMYQDVRKGLHLPYQTVAVYEREHKLNTFRAPVSVAPMVIDKLMDRLVHTDGYHDVDVSSLSIEV